MALRKRRPLYFKVVSYTPKNRMQQERIRIPQPPDRPIRLIEHDAIKRENVYPPDPAWYTEHKRGPVRRIVGEDYQESRAIPKHLLRGTLPERIEYAELIKRHYQPGLDFTFQSSLDGGRFELGGMVVDFLFEYLMIALRIQGYTHRKAIQQKKDEEQAGILASMGFTVLDLDVKTIRDPYKLEQWHRRYLDYPGAARALEDIEETWQVA